MHIALVEKLPLTTSGSPVRSDRVNLRVFSSVSDPLHFGVDPDPRIHASD
jgi:hypothetical protein